MKKLHLLSIFVLTTLRIEGSETEIQTESETKINGKIDASVANYDSNSGQNVNGSITIPIKNKLSFQFDGQYTDVSNRDFYGVGSHLFWRDSEIALLGITAGGVFQNDLYSVEAGVEAEYYFDWLTFSFNGGISKIKYDDPVPFIETDKTGIYSTLGVSIYPIKNMVISAGYSHRFDNNFYGIDAEYELPIAGLSIFTELAKGSHNYDQALFGMRYYFGSRKNLKDRHRKDDPKSILTNILSGIGTYGAEFNRNGKDFAIRNNIGNTGSFNTFGSVSVWASPIIDFGDFINSIGIIGIDDDGNIIITGE